MRCIENSFVHLGNCSESLIVTSTWIVWLGPGGILDAPGPNETNIAIVKMAIFMKKFWYIIINKLGAEI